MSRPHLITLLTDFGEQDVYVGVMKGVIAQFVPQVSVIDLTHHIPPQDVWAAQFNLSNAYHYFPPETIHVVVVDPGVGSQRRGVAVQATAGYFIAPDNGVLTPILQRETIQHIVSLDNPEYWRTLQPSTTFHGRDIFAPVAAHLAQGIAIAQLGSSLTLEDLQQLPFSQPQVSPTQISGQVQYIDHFGNCMTNIPAHQVMGRNWELLLSGQTIPMSRTYSDRDPGEVAFLIGSHGWVEVAINQGNAQVALQWQVGSSVTLRSKP